MAKKPPVVPDRITARGILETLWAKVLEDDSLKPSAQISELVNSGQTAIRFCLPTQLLGKLADHNIDAVALQRGDGEGGKWDPRGFASAVIVPWNRANQGVLGNSGDPYVSNPLRRPRADYGLDQMAEKAQWTALCDILITVQEADDEAVTKEIFTDTLVAIRDRLRDLTFTYIVPARVSLTQTGKLVSDFLSERSGGDRGLAIVAALFETYRERFGIYSKIRRGVINASDASTGAAGDLECIGEDGTSIILAVEVKERRIGDADIHIAVAKAREFSVRELLLCTDGINPSEQEAAAATVSSAWASGTNVYHATIQEMIKASLPLLGEAGIRGFVVNIGSQLDAFSTQPKHRKAWKTLLDGL